MSSRIWIGFLALIMAGLAFGQSTDFHDPTGQAVAQHTNAYGAENGKVKEPAAESKRADGAAAHATPSDHPSSAQDKPEKSSNYPESYKDSGADKPLAPNWMLPDLQGNQVSLYQEANQGRMTVMVFWATWCRNCKILLPKINDLKTRAGDLPVAFYLLNIWEDGDPLVYVQKHELELQVILRADHVAKRFDVSTTPGVVVVDANRHIIYQRPNGISMDEVVSDLEQVLGMSAATQRR